MVVVARKSYRNPSLFAVGFGIAKFCTYNLDLLRLTTESLCKLKLKVVSS